MPSNLSNKKQNETISRADQMARPTPQGSAGCAMEALPPTVHGGAAASVEGQAGLAGGTGVRMGAGTCSPMGLTQSKRLSWRHSCAQLQPLSPPRGAHVLPGLRSHLCSEHPRC